MENEKQKSEAAERPSDKQIQEWKDEYGTVLLVEVDSDKYYFRLPNRQTYKRYMDTIASGKLTDGLMIIVADCILHPSATIVNERINDNLQLPAHLSGEIQRAVGGDAIVFSKKL